MANVEAEKFIVGIYEDDNQLLQAVETIQHKGVKIADVFTPFPVHGLDKLLGYKESRLPDAGFVFALTGTTLALLMQIWMYAIDWPVNVGGKPRLPLPSFIPITFELTVLLCALGMVGTFFYASRLLPGIKTYIIDPRQTDDRFVVTVKAEENQEENSKIQQLFLETGAVEVREQEFKRQFLNVEP
ncbi:MAG: DUF3341 domain-containing protein [Bacteroidia bacterium]|nr:DUF3341 domain-containing protein [Bacteroidia bacterium]MDW8158978.1 DUF3341 domain-containing protein [Bacteroidia bacterium]